MEKNKSAKIGKRPLSKNRQYLEEMLREQLCATDEELKKWEKDSYRTDGKIVSKFWDYVDKASQVIIIGDYDVDGVCASHILSTSIRSKFPNKKTVVRIPRRFSEGYGINDTIADEIISTMPFGSLVVTVDNGIAAAPVLERLKSMGYYVIVTDHHAAKEGANLPEVDMLLDPAVKELDNPFSGDYWCGAGVAYKLCEPVIEEKLAKELEVFAGVATVADCMELREGNWGLVRRSIKAFRNKTAPQSLTMLLLEMKQAPEFCNEDHFGFYLGPAINAPGRLLDRGAVEVLKYFYKPTEEGCKNLVDLNNQRKAIRDEEFEMVKQYIADNNLSGTSPIWVAIEGLHEGIVGILAGKVSEEYKTPAVVLTNIEDKPGMLKGSARSYGEFDIFKYLSDMSELFDRMGGHKGAAGLSMTEENFKIARKNQINYADALDIENSGDGKAMQIEKWEIPGIHTSLNKFRPFGVGNAVPKFEVRINGDVDNIRMIGGQKEHLLVEDANKRYKITHFFHAPNSLADGSHFGLKGIINGSAFAGKETPTFNAEEVFDIVDDMDKGR